MTGSDETDRTAELRIDIVSDVVCPWCIIGYKQLQQALDECSLTADIRWHPFELNLDMAEDGENLREHLAAKYGTTPEGSRKARERLTALGAELGFTFNYTDDMRMVNTFRAHQLVHWAESLGRQHDMKMALFGAFFTRRLDLNDPEILADTAASIGLDRREAADALADARFARPVRAERAAWMSQGIQAVPAMVFNRSYLASGAQGAETYSGILRQLADAARVTEPQGAGAV